MKSGSSGLRSKARAAVGKGALAGAIYGIGVDLVAVERMERVHGRHGERLVERLLHPSERREFAKVRRQGLYLAKAFAAKEAFVKALGTGFVGIAHDEVGVARDRKGKPAYVISRRVRERLRRLGVRAAHVSLSDEGGWACAFAVLERARR